MSNTKSVLLVNSMKGASMNKIVGAAFVALILSVTLLLLMGVAVIGLEFWREVFG